MSEQTPKGKTCIIIGASHAGVNCAFALRREGWEGKILLFDTDPALPYHRPPLSKAYLSSTDTLEQNVLKAAESYQEEGIRLHLGCTVSAIDLKEKSIQLEESSTYHYDKLVLATGARPIIPPIAGIQNARHVFPIRTAADAKNIRQTFLALKQKRVVIIGGGYIGLETAASLRKLGAEVTVLEREKRILSRVTAPEMAAFIQQLHTENGVTILSNKNVSTIETKTGHNELICADGSRFIADLIIVGVGIQVNKELAASIDLEIENGIKVDTTARTSNKDIYAIGDCTFHHNPHYDRSIRLESVQNAVDQAKVAAAAICGKQTSYNTIPWFWSDQYDIKLQLVGLSLGYNEVVIRKETGADKRFSIWYFKDDTLLAVDAVNNAKAYMLGTKFIKSHQKIDKAKLADSSIPFKPSSFVLSD